jgi:hypothetical protein
MDINNRNRIVSFQTSPDRDEILVEKQLTQQRNKSRRDGTEFQFNKPHANYEFRFYQDDPVGEICCAVQIFRPLRDF